MPYSQTTIGRKKVNSVSSLCNYRCIVFLIPKKIPRHGWAKTLNFMNTRPKINFGTSPQNTISQNKFQIELTAYRYSTISFLEKAMQCRLSSFRISHICPRYISNLVAKQKSGLVGGAA